MNRRQEVVYRVNLERKRHGRRPLKSSPLLRRSAQSKARYLSRHPGDFSHGTWWTRFARRIRKPWGENIARRQDTPAQVVKQWMDSPTHRANILNEEFRLIGVGFARRESEEYWAQHFGG